MSRLVLPPTGWKISTSMLFDSQMPAAVFRTWLQLHSLTWRGNDIPAISMQEWVDRTRTSRPTIIRHLNLLQELNYLRWHAMEPGYFSITFLKPGRGRRPCASREAKVMHAGSTEPILDDPLREGATHDERQSRDPELSAPNLSSGPGGCPNTDSPKMDCPEMDCPEMSSTPAARFREDCPILDSEFGENPPSLNHSSLSINSSLKRSGIKDKDQEIIDQREGEEERERVGPKMSAPKMDSSVPRGGSRPSTHAGSPPPASDPVAIFRGLVHFLPNPPQREQIARRVSDPGLWRETVCHWLTHGWSPKNVAGMLDLYGRGGPSSCRFCLLAGDSNSERPASRKKPWSNIDQTQVYIDELRREMGLPDPGDHP